MIVLKEFTLDGFSLTLYEKAVQDFRVVGGTWKNNGPHFSTSHFASFDAAEAVFDGVVKALAEPAIEQLSEELAKGASANRWFVEDFAELIRLELSTGDLSLEELHQVVEHLRAQVESDAQQTP